MRILKILSAALLAAIVGASAGCGSRTWAQSTAPDVVTLSWTLPTLNTDGTVIVNPITVEVFQVVNGAEQGAPLATGVTGTSTQIQNAPVGDDCYVTVVVEAWPDGTTSTSVPSNQACVQVTGTTTTNPPPEPPTNAQATAG